MTQFEPHLSVRRDGEPAITRVTKSSLTEKELTVYFAVNTEEEASITVSDSEFTIRFGGTGTTSDELEKYKRAAIVTWRTQFSDYTTPIP
jgi:hypothetical protein